MKRLLIGLFLLLGFVGTAAAQEANAPTNTFVVTSTSNAGASGSTTNGICTSTASGGVCTLRAAIEEANGTAGTDTITFNINGAGPHVIQPTSPLPTITSRVTIDGDSQPNADCPNVLEPADLRIVIDGTNAGNGANGLSLDDSADNSIIRGLVIINFDDSGIYLYGADSVKVECNHIGVAADGTTAAGNYHGVDVRQGSNNNIIGGTINNSRTQRNVISGNRVHGINMTATVINTTITGNYIGVDRLGISALGNEVSGISILDSNGVEIGGANVVQANIISANLYGIYLRYAAENVNINNNKIGTDVLGISERGNDRDGIYIASVLDNLPHTIDIGSSAANIIAHNGQKGIHIVRYSGSGFPYEITARFNKIYNNGALGIDLGDDGVTPNDFVDNDAGPNELQNYPTITKADNTSAQGSAINKVTVQGNLFSNVNSTFTLDFYYSDSCDPSGFGEGQVYVGSTTVNTNNAQGSANYNIDFDNISGTNVVPPTDSYLTATATDTDGNTSEFSQCKIVTNESTLTVNSDDDENDGTCNASHCSLREAIIASNNIAAPESGTILFDMNSNYIKVSTPLPAITKQVRILGLTQPGDQTAACPADENTPAVINVQIDYVGGGSADGLHFAAGSNNSQVGGFSITNFTGDGIQIDSNNNFVYCNHIGVEPKNEPAGNGESGIEVTGENNVIGGAFPTLRNVISANGTNGVHLSGGRFNEVVGNIVGLDATGRDSMSNTRDGVRVDGSLYNVVGGSSETDRNVLSGNGFNGAYVNNISQAVTFKGNYIGLAVDGESLLGNGTNGIHISGGFLNGIGGANEGDGNYIGGNGDSGILLNNSADIVTIQGNFIGRSFKNLGSAPNGDYGIFLNGNGLDNNQIIGNTIAHSGLDGVRIDGNSVENKISQNNIFGNGELGIDLSDNGVSTNDNGDGDGGSNLSQNFPEILISADNLTVVGTLNSIASSDYTLEFFHNTSCDPSKNGEGERYIGSHEISLPGSGTFQYTAVMFYPDVPVGDFVTATTTDADGNTSEFSECVKVENAFIVNTTSDLARDIGDGQCNGSTGSALGGASCSLRSAIEEANLANVSNRNIYFAIEGGVHTLTPQSPYPSISSTVLIDGTAYQSDAHCPTEGSGSDIATLRIVLDGSALSGSTIDGFNFNGSSAGSKISGLAMGNFPRAAIHIRRSDITVRCNHLGIDNGGFSSSDLMPNVNGVLIESDRAVIGGNSRADRNVISGNTGEAVFINGSTTLAPQDTLVANNFIGTHSTGFGTNTPNGREGILDEYGVRTRIEYNVVANNTQGGITLLNSADSLLIGNTIGAGDPANSGYAFVGNGINGINVYDTSNVTIGGTLDTPTANVIVGSNQFGITTDNDTTGLVIRGNYIGSILGGLARGNGQEGIHLANPNGVLIGGDTLAEGNVIANNGANGIDLISPIGAATGNQFRNNIFYNNAQLAIDLGDDGPTPNDGVTDPDTGSNGLQNYPVVTSSDTNGITEGTMFGVNGDYDLYFYNNDNCDSSGYGEGQSLRASQRVTISGGNQVTFNVGLGSQALNSDVSAIAVRVATGDTSEFSPCVNVTQGVPTAVAVSGQAAVNTVNGQQLTVMLLVILVLSFGSVAVLSRRKKA